MIKIEKLAINDLEGLSDLYADAFGSNKTDLDTLKKTLERIEKDQRHHILVAKDGALVTGSVMGVICFELFGACNPFMVIENVAVLESHRRKGIARKLMQEIEAFARKEGCSTILFVSSQHRAGAHKLYKSLGFGNDKVNGYRKRL